MWNTQWANDLNPRFLLPLLAATLYLETANESRTDQIPNAFDVDHRQAMEHDLVVGRRGLEIHFDVEQSHDSTGAGRESYWPSAYVGFRDYCFP